jgi:hypothetical protein
VALQPYKVKVSGPVVEIGDPCALGKLAMPCSTFDDPCS